MRDYVYVEDAAALAWRAMDAARRSRSSGSSVHVLCSGENATVARLVDLVNRQGYGAVVRATA